MIANGLKILHKAGVALGGAISQDAVKVRLSADGKINVLFDKLDTAYILAKEDVSRKESSGRVSDLTSERGAASQQCEHQPAVDSGKAADIYALG